MANISPSKFVLRCYGHRKRNGRWYGVCLNLNLAAEAETREEIKKKLCDMIVSYIETVMDTDDHDSIPALLERRAPAIDWIKYYRIKLLITINNFPGEFTFKEFIPFKLAPDNC